MSALEAISAMSDAQLLALALGARGPDAPAQAAQWLEAAGGLRALAAESPLEPRPVAGFGAGRRRRLHAALEIARRCLERTVTRGDPLRSPADAAACFSARLADLPHEAFGCVFLDTRHRFICFEVLFRGTLDGAPIYPREVLRRALHHNAGALIVGHNHPSGDCEPSQADRRITRRLSQALELIDVRLLDHLVVSSGQCRSLAELGWL